MAVLTKVALSKLWIILMKHAGFVIRFAVDGDDGGVGREVELVLFIVFIILDYFPKRVVNQLKWSSCRNLLAATFY